MIVFTALPFSLSTRQQVSEASSWSNQEAFCFFVIAVNQQSSYRQLGQTVSRSFFFFLHSECQVLQKVSASRYVDAPYDPLQTARRIIPHEKGIEPPHTHFSPLSESLKSQRCCAYKLSDYSFTLFEWGLSGENVRYGNPVPMRVAVVVNLASDDSYGRESTFPQFPCLISDSDLLPHLCCDRPPRWVSRSLHTKSMVLLLILNTLGTKECLTSHWKIRISFHAYWYYLTWALPL